MFFLNLQNNHFHLLTFKISILILKLKKKTIILVIVIRLPFNISRLSPLCDSNLCPTFVINMHNILVKIKIQTLMIIFKLQRLKSQIRYQNRINILLSKKNKMNVKKLKGVKLKKKRMRTWIVGLEPDDSPTADGDGDGVPDLRVIEIELLRVVNRVVISESLSQNMEVKSMEMQWVILHRNKCSVLQNHLHRRIELQFLHLRGLRREDQRTLHRNIRIRVIEFNRRPIGKIRRINALHPVEKRLQHRQSGVVWDHERHVVHTRREPLPVRTAARPVRLFARGQVHTERDEHVLVHVAGHWDPVAGPREGGYVGEESVRRRRVVERR